MKTRKNTFIVLSAFLFIIFLTSSSLTQIAKDESTFSLKPTITEVYTDYDPSYYMFDEEENTVYNTRNTVNNIMTVIEENEEPSFVEPTVVPETAETQENTSEVNTVTFDTSTIETIIKTIREDTESTTVEDTSANDTGLVQFRVYDTPPAFTPETEETETTVESLPAFTDIENNTYIVEEENTIPEENQKIEFNVQEIAKQNTSHPFISRPQMKVWALSIIALILIGYILYHFIKKIRLFFPSDRSMQAYDEPTGGEIDMTSINADKVHHIIPEKNSIAASSTKPEGNEVSYGIKRYSFIADPGSFNYAD